MDDLPAVEMLWESADPGQELTNRFGFRDGAAAATVSGRNVMAWVEAGQQGGPMRGLARGSDGVTHDHKRTPVGRAQPPATKATTT